MYVYGACLFYVCCSDCVGVCENVCCVTDVVKDSGVLSLEVMKYVVCLCKGCDGCCVFCLYCEAWRCRCSCMGRVGVVTVIRIVSSTAGVLGMSVVRGMRSWRSV